MAEKVVKLPVLNSDGDNYESWKNDVKYWCYASSFPTIKQAIAIHLSLSGKARAATKQLKLLADSDVDPVDQIFEKLDNLFLDEKEFRQFKAFRNIVFLRRSEDCSIPDFIAKFEDLVFDCSVEDMQLPDPVPANLLLLFRNLSESQNQMVLSSLSPITYKGMRSALLRIFGRKFTAPDSTQGVGTVSGAVGGSVINIKSESALYAESPEEGDTYYSGGRRYGAAARGRGRGSSSRGSGRWQGRNKSSANPKVSRKQNPLGPDGKVSTCAVCSSTMHWIRDCPHSYEKADEKAQTERKDHEDPESVSFSMFARCADAPIGGSLRGIVDELGDGALIDSGCANTVCGETWLANYVEGLSDYQRAHVIEQPSNQTFTFGDSRTFISTRKVTLPCVIGSIVGEVITDVVACNIPLLISIKSMRKMGMIIDFGSDTLRVMGTTVQLRRSRSGHVSLPCQSD